MTKLPDPPGPIRLLAILFPAIALRISTMYFKIEETSRFLFNQILIHPAAALIIGLLTAVLTVMIGILIIVATTVAWIVTIAWINSTARLQKFSPSRRFAASVIVPTLFWATVGYGTFRYAPESEILLAIKRLSEQLERKSETKSEPVMPKADIEKRKSAHTKPTAEPPTIAIELAPLVVTKATRFKIEGKDMRHMEYGFAIVARISNHGPSKNLRAIFAVGDVDADFTHYISTFGVGRTVDEMDIEYGTKRPFHRVSLVGWPTNATKIGENDEDFIRFMFLDPTKISTRPIYMGTEPAKYFWFRDETNDSKVLTTVPNIYLFVNFAGREKDQFVKPDLRDEIKSGRLKFQIQFGSGVETIKPSKIQEPRMITMETWNSAAPQEIFFKAGVWDRLTPVAKDPVIEDLK